MAIRTIREIGDPVLNKTCKEVKEVTERTRELIDDMFETMYEANEAYYNGNTSGNSSTSNSKEVLNRDGSTTRITNRQSGSSVAQRAGMQRRQREEARKRASKPAGKSKNGYKNTKKLGL